MGWGQRGVGRGAKAQSEPRCAKQTQFRQRERRGKSFAGKDLWLIVQSMGLGKTNPIARQSRAGRDPRGGGRANAQNEPNSGPSPVPRGSSPAPGRGQLCKTNPIFRWCRTERGLGDVGREPNAQNEPNLPGGAGRPPPSLDPPASPRQADYAKQSQFSILGATRWARHPPPYASHTRSARPCAVAFDRQGRLRLSYRVGAAAGRPGKVQRLRKSSHENRSDRRG